MTNVLKAVSFRASRRYRQDRISSIQCLNCRLFIDTKHRSTLGWVHVETDDVSGFALEVGIVRSHVAFQLMRLEAGFLPDFVDHRLANAEFLGQLAARPMGGAVARLAAGGVEDLGAQPGRELGGRLPGAMGFESIQAVFEETLLPARNRGRGGVELHLDGRVGRPVSQHPNDLGSQHKTRRQGPRTRDLFQIRPLSSVQAQTLAFEWHIEKTSSL